MTQITSSATNAQRAWSVWKKLLSILVLLPLLGAIPVGCTNQGSIAEVPPSRTSPQPSMELPVLPPVPPSPSPQPPSPSRPSPAANTTPLTILSIAEGSVFIMKSGAGNWLEAQIGTPLGSLDVVKAGEGSRAVITFFEGSTIELEAGTQVEVAALDIAEETGPTTIKLKQEIGKTVSRVVKLTDPKSRYEVETPAGAAAVRGSIMPVSVAANGTTTVTNEQGSIWAIAQGVEVEIPEGMQCIIIPGQPPYLVMPGGVDDDGGGGGGGGGGQRPPPTPAIALTEIAQPTQVHDGDTITYTYAVTNPGNTPLSGVSVIDDKAGAAGYQSGDTNSDAKLNVGESWLFKASYTVSAADASPLVNTATTSGTDALLKTVTANATASVAILRPAIALTKTAQPTQVYVGDTVTYTYTVTNPGNTPLSGVSVIDDKAGAATYQSGDTNRDGKLDIGESWLFSASYTVSAADASPLVNTATASGTDALSKTVTTNATASITILIGLARINVQIDTGMKAAIYIWDDTNAGWAKDEDTQNLVDGTHHTTPTTISVVANHQYTVWVAKEGYVFRVKTHPKDWAVTAEGDKASGSPAEGALCPVHFTVKIG